MIHDIGRWYRYIEISVYLALDTPYKTLWSTYYMTEYTC